MLEYIYTLFQEKDPNALIWTDNLEILNEAVTIDLTFVNANVSRYDKQVKLLSNHLKQANEHFVNSMKPFYESADKQLKMFKSKLNKLNNELKSLRKWFDIEDTDGMEFLKQINSFRKLFQKVGVRLSEKKRKAERKAKREREKKSKGKRKKKKICDSDNKTNVSKESKRDALLRAMENKQQLKPVMNTLTAPVASISKQWSTGSRSGKGQLKDELLNIADNVK
eukprot:160061_1